MKTRILQGLALACGVFIAAAQASASDTVQARVVGKDLTTNTIIVDTEAGQRLAFQTIPTTMLVRPDGSVMQLGQLEVGDRIEIATDTPKSTTPIATRVVVLAPVGGIVTAPGTDRVELQTDNTGKASGYRPSQQTSDEDKNEKYD